MAGRNKMNIGGTIMGLVVSLFAFLFAYKVLEASPNSTTTLVLSLGGLLAGGIAGHIIWPYLFRKDIGSHGVSKFFSFLGAIAGYLFAYKVIGIRPLGPGCIIFAVYGWLACGAISDIAFFALRKNKTFY